MGNTFGKNLKILRTERSFSQQKLANLIEVSQQCVSEWENGNIQPTLPALIKLSDVFEITIDELVGKKRL